MNQQLTIGLWLGLFTVLGCRQGSETSSAASQPLGQVERPAEPQPPGDETRPYVSGQTEPQEPTDPYARDIFQICHVVSLSGADQRPMEERTVITAVWLAKQIATEQGKQFLRELQPLQGPAKADALVRAAAQAGVTCPLADEWRKG